jgi:hypothetical protein
LRGLLPSQIYPKSGLWSIFDINMS